MSGVGEKIVRKKNAKYSIQYTERKITGSGNLDEGNTHKDRIDEAKHLTTRDTFGTLE